MGKRRSICIEWVALILAMVIPAGCQTTAVMEKRPNTIAVWDIENLNASELSGFDLEELLAAKVIEVLQKDKRWTVVEREELILALEEQNLGGSALASDETRLQIGRLLGANYMVFGSYMKFMQQMQLNLRVVDVETGRVMRATQKTLPFKDVGGTLDMAAEAAGELFTSAEK